MCGNCTICWVPIIEGGKMVRYNVVVTNFCSNFCCKTTRNKENTHYLLTYVVEWSHRRQAHYAAAVLGCYKPLRAKPRCPRCPRAVDNLDTWLRNASSGRLRPVALFFLNFVGGTKSIMSFLDTVSRRSSGPRGKDGRANRGREYCGGSISGPSFFRFGGLARSQISGRGGARWVFGLSQSGAWLKPRRAAA